GRLRPLPVLDGYARDDRVGRDAEPHPSRGVRRDQGGAEADPDAARDAAVGDPPAQHAHAAGGGRHHPLPRARLLPRSRDRGRPRRLRRRACTRPARPRERGREAVGPVVVETGRLPVDGVQRMFDRIAPVYDAMNRVMTAGLDRRWRRVTVEQVVRNGDRVLDACCGTGDLAIAARARGADVVGLDFSEAMLERAGAKSTEIEWVRGDVLALPFDDASFDAVTVGFGVRNVDDLDAGLRELRRVLRPGGRLGILEITRPRGIVAPFYRL